jgi:hypothetical protein
VPVKFKRKAIKLDAFSMDEIDVRIPDEASAILDRVSAPFTVNAGGGVMTRAEIAAALKTAINAGSDPVTVSDGSGTDKIYVRTGAHGTAFRAAGTTNCLKTEDSMPMRLDAAKAHLNAKETLFFQMSGTPP